LSISLGVWDLFAYTVPGSLYLSLGIFIAAKFAWIKPSALIHGSTVLLVIGGLVISYILGHATSPLAHASDLLIPGRPRSKAARQEFAGRTPAAAKRPYVQADMALLRAAIEVKEKESALELARIGATWHMMRNCSVALALGSVTSIVCAITGSGTIAAVVSACVLGAAAAASLRQSRRFRSWWYLKTLETSYWIPGIDELIDPQARRAQPAAASRLSAASRKTSRRWSMMSRVRSGRP